MPEIIVHIDQPTDWMQLVLSVSSILTSIIAIIISVSTYISQVRHNKNSVKPILDIICGDYGDELYVRVDNNGVGPATIIEFSCQNKQHYQKNCLYKLISHEYKTKTSSDGTLVSPPEFNDYVEEIEGRTIAPNGTIILILLLEPTHQEWSSLRSILKNVTVYIKYTDIYGKETFKSKRALTFFGRKLIKE